MDPERLWTPYDKVANDPEKVKSLMLYFRCLLLEGRRSVLSLCVKHRHIAALTFLVETFPDLLHTKDADGKTIMCFALKYKHPEIIAHLSRYGAFNPITAMVQNASGMSPIVLALIAQMAHAASLSPLGGFWQDTTKSHEAGKVVVASTHPILYKLLNHSNNVVIASSLLVILLFTIGAPKTSTIYSAVVLLETIAALGAVLLGYGTTVIISSPVEIQPGQVIAIVGFAVVLFLAAVTLTKRLVQQSLVQIEFRQDLRYHCCFIAKQNSS